VIIGYRTSEAEAERLTDEIAQQGGNARAVHIDVALLSSVEGAFLSIDRTEGRFDLLINNVGNYNPQPIDALEPEHWDATIQSNLSGGFYCCFHALKRLRHGGQIINIGMAGLHGCGADTTGLDYHVSKSAMLVVTRSLAKAYASRGVRVNMVSPGMLTNSIDFPKDVAAWVPIGRGGELDDVGQAVSFILDASYVTGVNIDVAGGYRL
jgi:NAD(P)-dependent dehydrogenase (short-subunit alcohol dehydrogenase family)